MSDPIQEQQEAKDQAAAYVVEEAQSWNTGSPVETVKEHLEQGLREAEVEVPAEKIDEIAEDIHAGEQPDTDGLAR